jgi:hypothetical protein
VSSEKNILFAIRHSNFSWRFRNKATGLRDELPRAKMLRGVPGTNALRVNTLSIPPTFFLMKSSFLMIRPLSITEFVLSQLDPSVKCKRFNNAPVS